MYRKTLLLTIHVKVCIITDFTLKHSSNTVYDLDMNEQNQSVILGYTQNFMQM